MNHFSVRTLCKCSLLVALYVVLNRFVSFQALGLKFGVSFIPMAMCAILFGPWCAALSYAVGDIIGSLLFPMGAYFPGFTLSCALMGLVYGLFFYRKEKLSLWKHILPAALLCCGVLGLGLNSFWMSLLYTSKGFTAWVLVRLPQEAGVFILHVILLPAVYALCRKIARATHS